MTTTIKTDERRPARGTSLIFCKVRACGGGWIETILRDFSCTGFTMAKNRNLRVGSQLSLQFADLEPKVADVRWRGRWEWSCQFKTPLCPHMFDRIVSCHGMEIIPYRPRKDRLAGYRA